MRTQRGQSLVEFAITLPAVLSMLLLSVRVIIILIAWYRIVDAADIGVRAAALTGSADSARQVIYHNLSDLDQDSLSITFIPDTTHFGRPPTTTPLPSVTPNPLTAIDPKAIPDFPLRITVTYTFQVAGPLFPAWTINLTASATARIESRLTPLPTLPFF